MNNLKKYMGFCWMLLAPAMVIFMIWQAIEKIGQASSLTRSNITLQWSIILLIFIPICIGFFIFGWYASSGMYAKKSTDI
jgi:hypothetical protein